VFRKYGCFRHIFSEVMTDERIIAYLLNELSEEEAERFEDECFASDDWPQEITLAEEDLIDAYLRHELTGERRQRFEQNYLSTEARQERVRIAAALLHHVDERNAAPAAQTATNVYALPKRRERFPVFSGSQSWAYRAAAVLIGVAVIAGALWFYLSRQQPKSFTTLNLAITIGSTRGGDSPAVAKVKLPPEDGALKVNLKLPEGTQAARTSRVTLEKESGEAKALEITERNAQSVTVVIPANQLERAQYVLKLFERKDDGTEQRVGGSYFFTVE
jgi:hypothetical protein